MNLPLFLILQFFIPFVWSQGLSSSGITLSPSSSSSSSSSAATLTSQSATAPTGSANSTALSSTSATTTSSAQFPSLSGVPVCVTDCLAQAAAANCSSEVDVNCFCPQPIYPTAVVYCVLASCPDQVTTIESLAQAFCNVATAHPTLSFPSLPVTLSPSSTSTSSSTSNSASTTASTSTSATPTRSTAFSWKHITGSTALMGIGIIIILGIVVGAR